MVEIKIEKVLLTDIKSNPDNPRTISQADLDRLSKSLQDFPEMMELREVVVDEGLTILGGNMRHLALQKIGATECIAKIVTGLTDEQKKEFLIKDNSNFGKWNFSELSENFENLPLQEWGLPEMQQWKEPNDLAVEFNSEEEIETAERTSDEIIKAISGKIKIIAGKNPKRLNSAICVVAQNGSGNDVLFLSDPNLADIVKELKRYAESGEYSPLEKIVGSLA